MNFLKDLVIMKSFINGIVVFLFVFHIELCALNIVAKVNVTDNFLYLDENDPHREVIMKIIEKYEWPTSLIYCTDQELHDIFKDKQPFSEMIYIQKKIRQITKDNSYVVIWIPPLVAQLYAISKQSPYNNFSLNSKSIKNTVDKMFSNSQVKIVYPKVIASKDQKIIEKKILENTFFINSQLYKKDRKNIPYLWNYFCIFLREFQDNKFITYNGKDLVLNNELIIQMIAWFRLSLNDESISLIYNLLQKEYDAAYDNGTCFSRATNPFAVSKQTIKSEINRYEE